MEARPRRVLSQGRAAGEVRKVHWNRLVRGVAGQREQRQREQRSPQAAEQRKKKKRHEGGVEPLALSRSTDLKSAPRTDEDHHGP